MMDTLTRKRLISGLCLLVMPQVCYAQTSEASADGPAFRLATVNMIRHCADPELVADLNRYGFAIDTAEVKYSFFTELPEPVIQAEKLRFSRVRLATGEELELDAIRLAAKTYGGVRHTYSNTWGVRIDHTGQRLMINLVIDRQQVEDLGVVEGQINLMHGQGRKTISTDLMLEEKGYRDEKTGASVSWTMRWGLKGRNIQVELPIPRDRVGAVQVLDAEGRPLPFVEPQYFDLIPKGGQETTIKLFVEKPEGTPFKLRLTTFEDNREETMPFRIENVSSKAFAGLGTTSKPAGPE